jgi:hypothetical protein
LNDRFQIEEQKSAVATATAARDPNPDITITDLRSRMR